MSNIIRLGGGGGDLDQIQFTQNGDYYAEDYGIDGFYACYVRVNAALDQIKLTQNGVYLASTYGLDGFNKVTVAAGGGFNEILDIIFPASMIGETWTVEATGTGAETEFYTGTVDATQISTVTLTQQTTEYTIECAGISVLYTTGGVNSVNLGAAAIIMQSMLNLHMTSNDYTDNLGVRYIGTTSSDYRGEARCVFDDDPSYWICNNRTSAYVQLQISTPCKVKEFEITSDFDHWGSWTYLVQGSNDGITWDTIRTIQTDGTGEEKTTKTYELNPSKSYSYYCWFYSDFTGIRSDYLPCIYGIKFTKVTA